MNLDLIDRMKHSPIRNYAVPGLTSWLIGMSSEKGCVRLFESERAHQEPIIPRSHRFDFSCLVIEGKVLNRVWGERGWGELENECDLYQSSELIYDGKPGEYRTNPLEVGEYSFVDSVYSEGDRYSMTSDQIHSIYFSKGAKVLFFEGEKRSNSSIILQPISGGNIVPTFKVEDWMFQRG